MKKTIVALLSVVALLVFTASAFALHETQATYTPGMVTAGTSMISLGGSVMVRGEANKNLTHFDNNFKDTLTGETDRNQFYDERVRLGVQAKVSNNTMGMLELESGDANNYTYTWGQDPDGNFNSKPTDMTIRQAFIAHEGTGLLGVKSGFKAGHILLALGNNLWFDHTLFGDDAFILWTTVGGGELSYINIKAFEQDPSINDDFDIHVLAYGTAMNGINLSGDVTYVRGHDKSFYDKGTNLWNIGLRGDANVAGIKAMADVEIQAGTDKEDPFGGEMKHSGYAFMLGAEANVGPANVHLKGAYGSGDDDATDDKDKAFNTVLSDEQYFTYVYGYKACSAASTTCSKSSANAPNTGLTNTWYINAGASANATPDLKVSGDVYFLRAAKKISDVSDMDSKKIGWELDGKAEYKIDNNLAYFVEGGILFAGDLYKNFTGGEDPDNAWSVRHGVVLNF